MKKRLLFGITAVLFLTLLISNSVSATVPIYVGECSPGELGQQKEIFLENNCGSVFAECTYQRPFNWNPGGYRWFAKNCIVPGKWDNPCCTYPTCGYSDVWTSCESCKGCDGKGECNKNYDDWRSCQEESVKGACLGGTCDLDEVDPVITNNQENVYIRDVSNIDEIYNLTFDVDFSEDLRLKNFKMRICNEDSSQYFANRSEFFPAPVIIDGCAEEVFPLTGTSYTEDWKLSNEMWDWIIDTVLNQGKVSMNIELIDEVNKVTLGNLMFFIISDFTKPEINISHTLVDVVEGKKIIITANIIEMFGDFEANIFINGKQVGETCIESPCVREKIFSEGAHSYYAHAIDPSGNNATSETKTFELTIEPTNCEDFFGQICTGDKICEQDTFSASDTSKCCPGSCVEETVEIATCDEQEGKVFNPKTFTCAGNVVAASGINNLLRCCIGTINEIPDTELLEVYWEDSAGNKLSSTRVGEEVKCSAGGIKVSAELSINGEAKTLILPTSIDHIPKETGFHECEVTVRDITKSAILKVIEAPAPDTSKTALPVFGFFNALIALSFILAYYIYRIKRD